MSRVLNEEGSYILIFSFAFASIICALYSSSVCSSRCSVELSRVFFGYSHPRLPSTHSPSHTTTYISNARKARAERETSE